MKITCLLALLAALCASPVQSQTPSVLLLSDIHLDPFHDPAKFPQLLAAPIERWSAILDAPPSPTQAADFTHLQATCGARGIDTPNQLLASSLHAAHAQQPHPLFVTVSGDLMAHNFDCRFHTLNPTGTPAAYSAFAAKTVAYVALRLRETFPHTPIYLALGNNDSGCSDYREDPNSAFLHADALAFAADTTTPGNHAAVAQEFSQYGDYNVTLPLPNTRLLVLQDIFESSHYTACNAKPSLPLTTSPSTAQIAWLRTQLDAARAAHQRIWVMAHIPPGVDAYSTLKKSRNAFCSSPTPEFFLSSNALATTLADYADIIKLALFGHTHMDEFRTYKSVSTGAIVPAKLVPSISPVNGNNPAFTFATVDPATAVLQDYTVFAADNQTGSASTWSEEYRYSSTYHQPDLSGASLATLLTGFTSDKSGATEAGRAYQRFFFVTAPNAPGSLITTLKAAALQTAWPVYACSLANPDATSFAVCACPSVP